MSFERHKALINGDISFRCKYTSKHSLKCFRIDHTFVSLGHSWVSVSIFELSEKYKHHCNNWNRQWNIIFGKNGVHVECLLLQYWSMLVFFTIFCNKFRPKKCCIFSLVVFPRICFLNAYSVSFLALVCIAQRIDIVNDDCIINLQYSIRVIIMHVHRWYTNKVEYKTRDRRVFDINFCKNSDRTESYELLVSESLPKSSELFQENSESVS